jgi:hypothetical protein
VNDHEELRGRQAKRSPTLLAGLIDAIFFDHEIRILKAFAAVSKSTPCLARLA